MAKTPWSKVTTEQKNILSNSLKALAMIINFKTKTACAHQCGG